MRSPTNSEGAGKRLLARWALVAAWLGYWLYRTRYAMLDDALIHLRYASHLHDVHFITYDGVHASYGTSSILYVILLAFLRNVTHSALLPKIVSCTCYIALIVVLMAMERRFERHTESYAVWLGLLLTTLSPMAIRWLTDGMETGMVVLAATLFAMATEHAMQQTRVQPVFYLLRVLAGMLIVLLRVELAALALLATCGIFVARLEADAFRSRKAYLLDSSAFAVGAVLGMIAIRLALGNLLPDTALAKSGGASAGVVIGVLYAVASSVLLGVSSLLLTLVSGALYLHQLMQRKSDAKAYLVLMCTNGGLPLVVFLACLRGQAIQGVRYVLWTMFFATVWNMLALERLRRQRPEASSDYGVSLTWAYAAVLLCLLPFDWHYAARAMAGRSQTFLEMRSAGLERYRHTTLIAGDVGFIGYFTGGNVCDVDGLVNGREVAKLKPPERIRRCVAQNPQLLFVSRGQEGAVGQYFPLEGWAACKSFDFTNATGNDRHHLMVPSHGQADPCAVLSVTGPHS